MKRLNLLLMLLVFAVCSFAAKPLKVLAIGNSFSEDATEQYLSTLALMGGHDLLICNLYYPGCSIDQHWEHLSKKKPVYSYRKITIDGHVERHERHTLDAALRDEDWDIITFQQGSAYSGVWSAYRKLPGLIKMVREIVGPHPVFYWHQTWAYAPNSTHEAFKTSKHDQIKMFDAIVECTKKVLASNPELKGLIPCGTAIQDARTSELGPDLTRDGYHLDKGVGRYIASCTWYAALFSHPFTLMSFLPQGMTVDQGILAREAVTAAIIHPYQITPVTLPTANPTPEPSTTPAITLQQK